MTYLPSPQQEQVTTPTGMRVTHSIMDIAPVPAYQVTTLHCTPGQVMRQLSLLYHSQGGHMKPGVQDKPGGRITAGAGTVRRFPHQITCSRQTMGQVHRSFLLYESKTPMK